MWPVERVTSCRKEILTTLCVVIRTCDQLQEGDTRYVWPILGIVLSVHSGRVEVGCEGPLDGVHHSVFSQLALPFFFFAHKQSAD